MHPQQGGHHQHEQQHEATAPQAGEIQQHAESQRQQKPAQATDHADHAADRADVVGVILRDVFVHCRLAQGHEDAEDEHQQHEENRADGQRERDVAFVAVDYVIGGRVGQDEGAGGGDDEGEVHDRARAVAVRQPAAVGAKQAGGDRVQRADHAGGLHVEMVGTHQIARQPQRQADERAEHEKVVKGEAPDLEVFQRFQLLEEGFGRRVGQPSQFQHRVVLGGEPEHYRHQHQRRGPDLRHRLPAEGDHDERRGEFGHCRADIAQAEDAQREALPLRREPARDIGDAHRERAAGDAYAQGRHQEHRVGADMGQQESGDRRRQHHRHINQASAVLVGPDAQGQPDQRAGQNRRADQQAEFGFAQMQVLADLQADDGENSPHREADGESHRAGGQRLGLLAGVDGGHVLIPLEVLWTDLWAGGIQALARRAKANL